MTSQAFSKAKFVDFLLAFSGRQWVRRVTRIRVRISAVGIYELLKKVMWQQRNTVQALKYLDIRFKSSNQL